MLTIAQAVEAGIQAAKVAEKVYIEKNGEPFYCGFAWIEIRVERTNSKHSKELISAGFEKDYKPKTLSMWNPGGSLTQSMDVKISGATAMVEVLRQNGIVADVCCRAD